MDLGRRSSVDVTGSILITLLEMVDLFVNT